MNFRLISVLFIVLLILGCERESNDLNNLVISHVHSPYCEWELFDTLCLKSVGLQRFEIYNQVTDERKHFVLATRSFDADIYKYMSTTDLSNWREITIMMSNDCQNALVYSNVNRMYVDIESDEGMAILNKFCSNQ